MLTNCVICDKELNLEEDEHVPGVSLGERWCKDCAKEELNVLNKEVNK